MEYYNKVIEYLKLGSITLALRGRGNNNISISGKAGKNNILRVMVYIILSIGYSLLVIMFAPDISESIFYTYYIGDYVRNPLVLYIGIAIAIILVVIQSKIIFWRKEGRKTNVDIYKRELPSNLRPAHVRMLMTDGKVDDISISSTIMNLIDRGYLEIKNMEDIKSQEARQYFFNRNLTLIRIPNKDYSQLFEFEKFLIEWIFGEDEGSNEIGSKTLRNILSKEGGFEKFQKFQGLVIISFPLKKYYKTNKENKKITEIYGIILGTSFILSITSPILTFFCIIITIYCAGIIFFAMPKYTLNEKGADAIDSWKDLKRYLTEFANFKNKSAEEIIIWDFYLTYSIVLNISSNAEKQINDFFGNGIYLMEESSNKNENITLEDIKRDEKESSELYKYYGL